ncbi:tetratricopeptide repeat protein [Candidatus Bipolaricaulota sp. J31]
MTPEERERICRAALARAEELRRAKRYKEGIDLLVEALKYGLEKPAIYFRLGNIYFDAGDLSRAEYAYKRAIEEDPRHALAHHNLGVVYRKQGKIGLSVKMLKKARRLELLHPRKAELSPEEKRVLIRMGFYTAAVILALIVGLFVLLYLISILLR